MMKKTWQTFLLCILYSVSYAQQITSDNINHSFWKPNSNDVKMAIDSLNEVLYTFGDFNYIGPSNAYIASGNINEGTLNNTPLLAIYDRVTCIVPDNSGGFFIGGSFSTIKGSARNGLAQIDASGNLTNWNPQSDLSASPSVTAMHLVGDILYVNGWSQTKYLVGLNTVTGELMDWDPRINLGVDKITSDDEFLYVGGSFKQANFAGYNGVVVSIEDEPTFLKTPQFHAEGNFNIQPTTAVPDGNGGWYIGGEFNHAGEFERHGFVHLNSSNEVTPLNWTKPGSTISAMAIDENKLYISGKFEEVGSAGWRTLSIFNLQTQSLEDWELDVQYAPSKLHIQGNKLFAAGEFGYAGDYSIGIGEFDINTQEWLQNIEHQLYGQIFEVISDNNGGWILAGSFNLDNVNNSHHLLHILADGSIGTLSIDLNLTQVYEKRVNSIALKNDTLFFAGNFEGVNGHPRKGLAAVNIQTNEILDWVFDATDRAFEYEEVKKIKCHENELFIVGDFATVNQTPRFGLASIDLITNELTTLDHSFDSALKESYRTINALEITDETIFVGGSFSVVGTQITSCVLDQETAEIKNPLSMVGAATASVSDGNGGWYIAGNFDSIQDQERKYLAHIDSDGMVSPFNLGLDYIQITDLELVGNKLIVAGYFSDFMDEYRKGLAVVSTNTHDIIDYQFELNSNVNVITLKGDTLFVGGTFSQAGGLPRNKLAAFKLSPNQPTLLSWNPTVQGGGGEIKDIEVFSDNVVVTGNLAFGSPLFGEAREKLAALNRYTGQLLPWNPVLDGTPMELYASSGNLYIGGSFTTVNEIDNKYIASFNAIDLSLNPIPFEVDSSVTAMTSIENQLYIGGYFSQINGMNRNSLASINLDTQEISDWYIESDVNKYYVNFLEASEEDIYVGWYSANFNLGGKKRDCLVAFDRDSYEILPYNPIVPVNPQEAVYDFDTTDEHVFVAGSFTQFDGEPRQRIAKVELDDLGLTEWAIDSDDKIKAVHATPEAIYIGGDFETLNGVERYLVAATNPNNAEILPWTAETVGSVFTIESTESKVIFGGILNIGESIIPSRRILVYDFDADELVYGFDTLIAGYNPGSYDFESMGDTIVMNI